MKPSLLPNVGKNIAYFSKHWKSRRDFAFALRLRPKGNRVYR
jgi:hypothetical protein